MALSGNGLAAALSAIPGVSITSQSELLSFCNAIVTYIKANAVITTPAGVPILTSLGTSGATTAPAIGVLS